MSMIITGSSHDNPPEQDYEADFLANGQRKIREFPLLYAILGSFSNYADNNHAGNTFLTLASHTVSDVFRNGRPNTDSERELREYEDLIRDLNLAAYPREKRLGIYAKMCSFDIGQQTSILQELDFCLELRKNRRVSEVAFDNLGDSNHDFRFKIDGEVFNLELTHLGVSEFEVCARQIFAEVAARIKSHIPDGHILKAHVITDKLLTDGRLEIEHARLVIESAILVIMPIILVKENEFFFLEDFGTDGPLIDAREIFLFYGALGERLNLLLETPEGRSYLENTQKAVLSKNPLKSISYYQGHGKLVEIQSECIWPSTAETLREMSMLNQIKRLLITKMRRNQLAGQAKPLLCLQLYDPILFRQYTAPASRDPGRIDVLKGLIAEAFRETGEQTLLGVLLYERNLTESAFIVNPNISVESEVITKLTSFNPNTLLN